MGRKKIQISRIQDERNRQTLTRKEHKNGGSSSHGHCQSADSDDDSMDACCSPGPVDQSPTNAGSNVDIFHSSSSTFENTTPTTASSNAASAVESAASFLTATAAAQRLASASSSSSAAVNSLLSAVARPIARGAGERDLGQRTSMVDQISSNLLASSYAQLLNNNVASMLQNTRTKHTLPDSRIAYGSPTSSTGVVQDDYSLVKQVGGSQPDMTHFQRLNRMSSLMGQNQSPSQQQQQYHHNQLLQQQHHALISNRALSLNAAALAVEAANARHQAAASAANNIQAPGAPNEYLRAYASSLSNLHGFPADFRLNSADLAMLRNMESSGLFANWTQNALGAAPNGLLNATVNNSQTLNNQTAAELQALHERLQQSRLLQQQSQQQHQQISPSSSNNSELPTNRPDESQECIRVDTNHSDQTPASANGNDVIVNPFSAAGSRQDLRSASSDGPAHKRSKGEADGQMDVESPPKSH